MSGLPTIKPWASAEANYPAGPNPWNGTPVTVPPAGDIFTPGTPPLAQNMNAILNGITTAQQQIAQMSQALCARNFQLPITWSLSTSGPHCMTWNDAPAGTGSGQSWLFAGFSSGAATITVQTTSGQDQSFSQIGGGTISATKPPMSIVADPNSNVFVTLIGVTGNSILASISLAGGAWSAPSGPTVTGATDCQLAALGSTIVYALAGASGQGGLGTLSTGASFSGSVTGLTFGSSGLIVKSNGTQVLATDRNVAANTLYKTTNGTSWNAQTMSSPLGASTTIQDIAWNAALGLWMITGSDGSHTAFWTSPDGSNWTKIATLGTTPVSRIASVGAMWGAQTNPTAHLGQTLYSFDGVTWWTTQCFVQGSSTATPSIAASPTQLAIAAIVNLGTTTGANPLRFGLDIGLPTAHL